MTWNQKPRYFLYKFRDTIFMRMKCRVFIDYNNILHMFIEKDLNLRQRQWMELIKDFDISILCHQGNTNMVVNALSWKLASIRSLTLLDVSRRPLVRELQSLDNDFMRFQYNRKRKILAHVEARSIFYDQIKSVQFGDNKLNNLRKKVLQKEAKETILDNEGSLRIQCRLCVPQEGNLIPTIQEEAPYFKYSTYQGANKIYRDLRQHYWW